MNTYTTVILHTYIYGTTQPSLSVVKRLVDLADKQPFTQLHQAPEGELTILSPTS